MFAPVLDGDDESRILRWGSTQPSVRVRQPAALVRHRENEGLLRETMTQAASHRGHRSRTLSRDGRQAEGPHGPEWATVKQPLQGGYKQLPDPAG